MGEWCTFLYKANDGSLDSNTANVTITVNSVNDAPTVNDITLTGDEDTVLEGSFDGKLQLKTKPRKTPSQNNASPSEKLNNSKPERPNRNTTYSNNKYVFHPSQKKKQKEENESNKNTSQNNTSPSEKNKQLQTQKAKPKHDLFQ